MPLRFIYLKGLVSSLSINIPCQSFQIIPNYANWFWEKDCKRKDHKNSVSIKIIGEACSDTLLLEDTQLRGYQAVELLQAGQQARCASRRCHGVSVHLSCTLRKGDSDFLLQSIFNFPQKSEGYCHTCSL